MFRESWGNAVGKEGVCREREGKNIIERGIIDSIRFLKARVQVQRVWLVGVIYIRGFPGWYDDRIMGQGTLYCQENG